MPDIVVVGAGLSGLLAALALASPEPGAGCAVTLVDAGAIDRPGNDGRATALAPSSLRMLARLGVALPATQPITGMRVGEGEADSPWQFELPARPDEPLGHIVTNAALRSALLEALANVPVTRIEAVRVEAVSLDGMASLSLSDGQRLEPALVIAADGRDSAVRRMAGLSVSRHDFRQSALVTTVSHAEPHEGIALQRFQNVGAIASLPLPGGQTSQIAWSDRTDAARAAAALPGAALAALIDERLWGALEVTGVDAEVQTYPLIAQRCEALSVPRLALVGDAARTIHPLAGQGFNLGIRDIAALVATVTEARATGQDIGTAGLIGYDRWRRADETFLGSVTAGLSSAPRGIGRIVGHIRRGAFAATDSVTALHPFLRREAAGDTGDLPGLLA